MGSADVKQSNTHGKGNPACITATRYESAKSRGQIHCHLLPTHSDIAHCAAYMPYLTGVHHAITQNNMNTAKLTTHIRGQQEQLGRCYSPTPIPTLLTLAARGQEKGCGMITDSLFCEACFVSNKERERVMQPSHG